MSERARQLVLDLPVDPRFGVEDFLVGAPNEEAYRHVEKWPDWPDPLLCLSGPPGSGKSHLAAIWAARAHARTVAAADVDPERVPDLAAGEGVVLEDIDRGAVDERALFHLLNIARERGVPILYTATAPIEMCGLATADLRSRLRRAPSITLGPPDDAILRAVLIKLFVDRQLVVDTSVVDYVATRMERSFARAGDIVGELDREALSRGRRITRLTAADVLGRGAERPEDGGDLAGTGG